MKISNGLEEGAPACFELFAGIGGFTLGFQRAGMRPAGFCEIEPFCRSVLSQHWPGLPIYEDVRTLTGEQLRKDRVKFDVLCGGFPCQDISVSGSGEGLSGKRSGLWFEFRRLIAETRPPYVVIENVAVLRSRGLDQILGGLHALGYDAEWHCIPASAVGAPHQRDRIWILAYTARSNDWSSDARALQRSVPEPGNCGGARDVANTMCSELAHWDGEPIRARKAAFHAERCCCCASHDGPKLTTIERSDWWTLESILDRIAHGVPRRVDRIKALGNALVPQIAEQIGRALMRANDRR